MSRVAFGALAVLRPSGKVFPSVSTCSMSSNVGPNRDPLVQYVVVRRDLDWPAGSVMAQAVHACVAAVWRSREETSTHAYADESGDTQMRTVVLQANNEASLTKLASELEEKSIAYVAWKEQPEDFVTAVAAAPYPLGDVKPMFKKFKLYK